MTFRHSIADKPARIRIRPWSASKERYNAYRRMRLATATYTYPQGAYIEIEQDGQKIPLLQPCIAGQHMHNLVRKRCRLLKETYPEAMIFITIPSKANITTSNNETT